MALDPVAAFMLGIIVGQWLGVLISLKVIRAMAGSDIATQAYALEKAADPLPFARLIYRQLLGAVKLRGNQAKRAPPTKKKSRIKAR